MRRERHLTFGGHVALELILGLALAVAPFIFDFDNGPTIVSLALGVATLSAALSTSVVGGAIATHQAWDRGLLVLLVVAAVISAIADAGADTAVFAVAAAIEATLLATTRYTPEQVG